MTAAEQWAAAWRAVIDGLIGPDDHRRTQGRRWERGGRVTDVRARPGLLSARVHGIRATALPVEVALPTLDADRWSRLVELLASEARHRGRLLAGQAPVGLAEDAEAVGIHLLPRADELDATCPCGEAEPVCAHAVALWESAATSLVDDPLLPLRLRGRGRERLLADVTAASRRAATDDGTVAVSELEVAGWRTAAAEWRSLPSVQPEAPAVPAPSLRVRGDPPTWSGGVSAWELLRPLVERAADWAAARLDDASGADGGGAYNEVSSNPGGR